MPTSSLSDDWEDFNMTDVDSVWDYYCINGLDHQLPEDTDPVMMQFAHVL